MDFVSIDDSDHVLRRVYPEGVGDDGHLKSTCFSDRDDCPSCHLERLTSPEIVTAAHPGVTLLARLNVGEIRRLGLDVRYQPTSEDGSHCVIVRRTGLKDGEKKIRRRLVAIAESMDVTGAPIRP